MSDTNQPLNLEEEIFNLCKDEGPLSVTQISIGLAEEFDAVRDTVEKMKVKGILADRADGTETADDPVVGLPTHAPRFGGGIY